MKHLDLTLDTPAENLACDEALLDRCEDGFAQECLRFWEPAQHFVVVGYANRVAAEVNRAACETLGIPILRRCSGGGTILQGPGCLNYSLILRIHEGGPTAGVSSTNRFVMEMNARALERLLGEPVEVRGHTDLVTGNLKFSGNAQRRKRRFLLFHGTFLLNFDLRLIERTLSMPTHEPAYRENRSHLDFLRNLNLAPQKIKEAMKAAWQASDPIKPPPQQMIQQLVTEKYGVHGWNFKSGVHT